MNNEKKKESLEIDGDPLKADKLIRKYFTVQILANKPKISQYLSSQHINDHILRLFLYTTTSSTQLEHLYILTASMIP